jgi:eukaryotic-like serine/threonine-protein kinase
MERQVGTPDIKSRKSSLPRQRLMENPDAATIAQQAVRFGLITPEQLQEGLEDVGRRDGEPEPLLLSLERRGYLTPWQSAKLLKSDTDGYFLSGYRILYKIASGSFGRVYRADDPRTGTIVAIKVLRRKWSEDQHTIELFEREGKVGMSLTHPNLVQILAVRSDVATKQYYIVMEFVEGGNLRDILHIHKKIEPVDALRIIDDATAGLAFAYSKGVTHRDMKLTNVLISSQGVAKLVDFGLAGVYTRAVYEDTSIVDRTVDYAGLEKATGVASGDVRSDIYFLGCVLYEILTGRSPLHMSRDARSRMSKERFLNVVPMRRDEVNGPASLFRLVETMMALNPLHRFQTPSQLLDAVREVRKEIEAKPGTQAVPSTRTIFIIERDDRLQDALREKFKERGYRVLIAADPTRALDRFRQQPFDGLIADVGTVGEESLLLFDRVMSEADRQKYPCVGIVMLAEEQADWERRLDKRATTAALIRPVTFKQILKKMQDLWEQSDKEQQLAKR